MGHRAVGVGGRALRAVRASLLAALGLFIIGGCGGGGGGGDEASPGPTPMLSLLAGNPNGFGSVDGTGPAARFNVPTGLAIDISGNIYVADTYNGTIRKVTPAGVVTTLAGSPVASGSADGTGAAARFYGPMGVAIDSAGNLYVADAFNATIRKVTPAGVVTTLAGMAGVTGTADGLGAAARFTYPYGIAIDGAGRLFVSDISSHTIRQVTQAGEVTTLAGTPGVHGSADGTGSAARFYSPSGLAIDNTGNLYVADGTNRTIRRVTQAGVVTTLAGTAGVSGSADGTGGAASFYAPRGVGIDAGGTLYVTDMGNHTIRKVTPAGEVTTFAGTAGQRGGADGAGANARFDYPDGAVVDAAGNVYVCEQNNGTIRKIDPAGVVTTLAGVAGNIGSSDGTGAAASFYNPNDVAADSAGNVYVLDSYNQTIRKVTPAGVVTTFVGTAGMTGRADGTGAAARFFYAYGLGADSAGNLYVADTSNNTIRKVTPEGVVTTLAGQAGVQGGGDGVGAAATFRSPTGVAADGAGNVYVADTLNHTIRKIAPGAVVTTLAGTAGLIGSADGTGPAARFNYPSKVAVDAAGNLYVADRANSTLRKITPAGEVTTLAGTAGAVGSADGTQAAARFNSPSGLAVDSAGNVYVADRESSTIRKVTPAGVVTTVVGQALAASFVPGSLPGLIAYPRGMVLVGTTLYFIDNYAVAKVTDIP